MDGELDGRDEESCLRRWRRAFLHRRRVVFAGAAGASRCEVLHRAVGSGVRGRIFLYYERQPCYAPPSRLVRRWR
eukprot:4153049-Pleurochrysis_carterae.AAC.1